MRVTHNREQRVITGGGMYNLRIEFRRHAIRNARRGEVPWATEDGCIEQRVYSRFQPPYNLQRSMPRHIQESNRIRFSRYSCDRVKHLFLFADFPRGGGGEAVSIVLPSNRISSGPKAFVFFAESIPVSLSDSMV